jgi:predicted DNA-binding helix-hairpin-helix protein
VQMTPSSLWAAAESDRDIVRTVDKFMDKYNLRRPYFMSFDPVPDTPLEHNLLHLNGGK